jgi:hypothetical protein
MTSTHKVTWGMIFNHSDWPLPLDLDSMKNIVCEQVPEFEYLKISPTWTNQLHGWDDQQFWVLEAHADISSEELAWISLKYPDSPRQVHEPA